MIDSAIFENLKNSYRYFDNEVEFHTNRDKNVEKDIVEADLAYVSKKKNSVLLIEETINPINKKSQMIAYGNISPQNLRLLTGTDFTPYLDTFLVVPQKHRQTALDLFEDCRDEIKNLGNKIGFSIWYYPESKKHLRCAGGIYSKGFPNINKILNTKSIGTFKILKKSCHPIYLLQFIVLKAIEGHYGLSKEGIEVNEDILMDLLKPYGIINKSKWIEAIKIGRHVGWFENVSLDSFTFTIKHTKLNAASISGSKGLASNFFEAIEEEPDKKQSSLFDFNSKNTFEEDSYDEINN